MTASSQFDRNQYWLSDDGARQGIGKRAAKGVAMTMSAQVLRLVLQIGSSAAFSRMLVPADFGLFAMATTVSSLVAVLGNLGLSAATVQARSLTQRTVSSLFFLSVMFSLGATLLTLALAVGASHLYSDSRVFYVSAAMAPALPIMALSTQHTALLLRKMCWKRVTGIPVVAQAISVSIAVLAAWLLDWGYWALVLQVLLNAVVTAAASWIMCNWRPSLTFDLNSCRSETRFGLNMTGFTLSNYFHRQMDNVLIGWRWGAVELGYYSRAYNLLMIPIGLINTAVGQSVMPLLARMQDEPARWRSTLLLTMSFTCFAGCAIASILVVNSHSLIIVLLGPGWEYTADIFYFLGLSLLAMSPMNTMGWIFQSLNQTDRWFRFGMVAAAFFPTAFALGLPFLAIGVAKAYCIAVIILTIPCIAYATRKAPVSTFDILATVRGPVIAGFATVVGQLLIERYLPMPRSPFFHLVVGTIYATAQFTFYGLLFMLFDPAQKALRETIHKSLDGVRARIGAMWGSKPETLS